MHHSFTGNARKTRQVNLSGRKVTDPWATTQTPSNVLQTAQGTQSTVAHAQADRIRRQQERDRLQASKRLQRIWRGHTCRQRLKLEWKQEWDRNEQTRLGLVEPMRYETFLQSGIQGHPYQDLAQLLSQWRLLIHFQLFAGARIKDARDSMRLAYFGSNLRQTLSKSIVSISQIPQAQWSSLVFVLVRHIRGIFAGSGSPESDLLTTRLVEMLHFLNERDPRSISLNAGDAFAALQAALTQTSSEMSKQIIARTTTALLDTKTSAPRLIYDAFVDHFLSNPILSTNSVLLDQLVSIIRPAYLLASISKAKPKSHNSPGKPAIDEDGSLWQLAYIICFRNRSTSSAHSDPKRQVEWLRMVAILLGRGANLISGRFSTTDQSADESRAEISTPLPPFIREQVATLTSQNNIKKSIQMLSAQNGLEGDRQGVASFDSAKKMADYAVALFRAFPDRAPRISKWLYECSSGSVDEGHISTIQYFWINVCRTNVFNKISQSPRNVLSMLKEPFRESHQINRPPASAHDYDRWRDEWKVILLFLELYTFVLTSMDDEEFFSLGDDGKGKFAYDVIAEHSKGAIPLREIGNMTTFLKNLAFTLYWNAADLVDSNDPDNAKALSSHFGSTPPSEAVQGSSLPQSSTLAGNDVTQKYLKDLVTRLLIMLHERDSRRNFLPEKHWLMTSQVDMTGFISGVVAEEERRHQHGEDESDDIDEEDLDSIQDRDAEREVLGSGTLLRDLFGIREPHAARSRLSSHMETIQRRQEQNKRKRQLESLIPRLEILRNLPFFIPFETRVQIFREFVYHDQMRRRDGYVDPDSWRMAIAASAHGRGLEGRPPALDVISRHQAEIHRESVFEDAYANFYDLGEGLKEPIQISFIDRFGSQEAGIDGGGVTKEFLMSVTSEALEPSSPSSLFQENEQRYLYPNPTIFDQAAYRLRQNGYRQGTDNFRNYMRDLLRRFEFLGRIVGKCIYEGILIDVNFAGFFLLKWAMSGGTTAASNEMAYRASINDLRDFDEALYQGLLKLKNYKGDVETDFALNFTVTDSFPLDPEGKDAVHNITRELMPDGANISVTNSNRQDYIDRIVRYRLHRQPEFVTNAFLKGLGQIIQPMWLAMFNQKELQKLVGGDNAELDIADLRRNTQYGGLYVVGDDGLEHPTVQLFWKALREMNDTDRRKVLKFVTSTPRAPLLGFGHLNPKFSIRDSSEDQTRLPSTSTCVNLLKLPRYGDIRTMREKLLYAVNSGAGFDLS